MNNSLCLRTLGSVGIHMGHYIMTYFLFPCLGHIIINVVFIGL